MSDDVPTLDASVPVRSSDPALDGRYICKQKLGGGGQAIVYYGYDTRTNETVAIKAFRHDELDKQDEVDRRNQMVEREKKIMCRVNHPNLIAFKDHIVDGKNHYLVQEYFEGRELNEYIEDRLIALGTSRGKEMVTPFAVIRSIAMQIASALAEMHAKNLVHRDVKPNNILIKKMPDGTMKVKLIDFGIGKSTKATMALPALTQEGMIVGTPDTMAPEQVEPGRGPIGPRSDLFSLGVVIYQLMTGEPPIDFSVSNKSTTSGSGNAMYFKLAHDLQLPLKRDRYPHALVKNVHSELEELALDLMEREIDKRPASAEVVYKKLEAMREVSAPPRSLPPPSAPRSSVRPVPEKSGSTTTGYRLPMNRSPKSLVAIATIIGISAVCVAVYLTAKFMSPDPKVVNSSPASTTTERSPLASSHAVATVVPSVSVQPTVPVASVTAPAVPTRTYASLSAAQRGLVDMAKREVAGGGKCSGVTGGLIRLTNEVPDFPDAYYYLAECAKRIGNDDTHFRNEYLKRSGGKTSP